MRWRVVEDDHATSAFPATLSVGSLVHIVAPDAPDARRDHGIDGRRVRRLATFSQAEFTAASSILPVATSTSLLYLVPAVAVLIAFAWLGEIPYPSELAGGAVVILGVVMVSQGDRIRSWRRRRMRTRSARG